MRVTAPVAARAREALGAVEARARRRVVAALTGLCDVHVAVLGNRHVARVVELVGDHIDVEPAGAGGGGNDKARRDGEQKAPDRVH